MNIFVPLNYNSPDIQRAHVNTYGMGLSSVLI